MSFLSTLKQVVISHQIMNEDQLKEAETVQNETHAPLVQIILQQTGMRANDLYSAIAKQMHVPYVNLRDFQPDIKLIQTLPESYARYAHAIVLQESKGVLWIGMADPSNLTAIDELKRVLNKPLDFALVEEDQLIQTINLVYRNTKKITSLAGKLNEELDKSPKQREQLGQDVGQNDAPVVKLLQTIFEDAIKINASDIHLEPTEKGLRVRLRVDGVLQEQIMNEKSIVAALTQRLKLMARLDISEKQRPQDGRFSIKMKDRNIDVRLSTLPMRGGESVVMRLMAQTAEDISIEDMGMAPDMLKEYLKVIKQPHGILLVTGPTGSGKTTTLYATLGELDAIKEKIMTIEDPIECELPNVVQTQVYSKINFNFADVLRTSLRQDPDVIMVGEIRDEETASIAMRAALTGHSVFSTLHTNDAMSTAIRLMDMGVKGFLVADALNAILAQRLTRKICSSCKADYTLTDRDIALVDSIKPGASESTFKYGKGCQYCYHTGYKGRIGIFEFLVLNQELRDALRNNDLESYFQYAGAKLKGHLLADEALAKALEGTTTVDEVRRIIGMDVM